MNKPTKESLSLYDDVHGYLDDYLPTQKGASKNTIESYRFTLRQLFNYVEMISGVKLEKLSFKNFSKETVENFLSYMENKYDWSVTTRNNKLAAIRSFFKYCGENDISVMNLYNGIALIPHKNSPEKEIEFFSEKALEAILATPDTSTKKGIRDLTLMVLLYDSAARVQELLDIKIKDLHLGKGADFVKDGLNYFLF